MPTRHQSPKTPKNDTGRKPLLVTAAVIRDGDRVLIARRPLDSHVEGGKWEFPGGKVEFGEHPEDCLKREILEELNLEISVDRFFNLSSHVYRDDSEEGPHIVLLCYLCTRTGGELKELEVMEARWIQPAELGGFGFAAADVPFLAALSAGLA